MSYHDPDRQKIRDIRAKHYEKLAKAKEEPKAKAEKFDRKAALAQVKGAGVNVAKNIPNDELKKIVADLEAGNE